MTPMMHMKLRAGTQADLYIPFGLHEELKSSSAGPQVVKQST